MPGRAQSAGHTQRRCQHTARLPPLARRATHLRIQLRAQGFELALHGQHALLQHAGQAAACRCAIHSRLSRDCSRASRHWQSTHAPWCLPAAVLQCLRPRLWCQDSTVRVLEQALQPGGVLTAAQAACVSWRRANQHLTAAAERRMAACVHDTAGYGTGEGQQTGQEVRWQCARCYNTCIVAAMAAIRDAEVAAATASAAAGLRTAPCQGAAASQLSAWRGPPSR